MANNSRKYVDILLTSIKKHPDLYLPGSTFLFLMIVIAFTGNPITSYLKDNESKQTLQTVPKPNCSAILPNADDVSAYLEAHKPAPQITAKNQEKYEKPAIAQLSQSEPDLADVDAIDAIINPTSENVPAETIDVAIGKRGTLGKALKTIGLNNSDITSAIAALTPIFNVKRLRPEHHILATKTDFIKTVEINCSALERYQLRRLSPTAPWQASRLNIQTQTEVKAVHGLIKSSIYQALADAGESSGLAATFADIFSWEIDFFREVRAGDRFTIIVQRQLVDGTIVPASTKILAAYYDGAIGQYQAYRQSADIDAYYDENGNSMRKAFLRAPLPFPRVTSNFGNRRHPVKGYERHHDGIDYGAEVGTPVWSVADGTVIFTGNQPSGAGLYVKIRYPNNYEAIYMHLKTIKVREGQRVKQKDIIALSGNTGCSTGPHLHYGLKKNGRSVNPATEKFPKGNPLNQSSMAAFSAVVNQYQALLLEKTDTHVIKTPTALAVGE